MDDKKWLKEALDKLDNKVDRLDQRLDSLDITSIKQNVQLENHIRRTELAEENIVILRDQIKPIQNHVVMLNGGLKLIGGISLIISMTSGIVKIIDYFSSR